MTKKFQSKTGLPEALGSNAHLPSGPRSEDPNRPEMCQAENCQGYRKEVVTLPNGKRQGVYERAKAAIYIRDKHGNLLAAVCQKCHIEHLEAQGKDQLSQVRIEGINAPQGEMLTRSDTPPGLIDHLRQIEDQLAEQWAAGHDD